MAAHLVPHHPHKSGRIDIIEIMRYRLKSLDITATIDGEDDTMLERHVADFHLLPPQAIVITHGKVSDHHHNVGLVRRLATQRSDVKCIIAMDKYFIRRELFDSQENYEFVREDLEKEFRPRQVLAVSHVLPEFIQGVDFGGKPIEHSFEKYMEMWKELRGKL